MKTIEQTLKEIGFIIILFIIIGFIVYLITPSENKIKDTVSSCELILMPEIEDFHRNCHNEI